MKLRQARKILFNKKNAWNRMQRMLRLRPPYYDEERKVLVHPSFANNPQIMKAWKVVKRHWRYNVYLDKPVRRKKK